MLVGADDGDDASVLFVLTVGVAVVHIQKGVAVGEVKGIVEHTFHEAQSAAGTEEFMFLHEVQLIGTVCFL